MKTTLPTFVAGWLIAMLASQALASDATADAGLKILDAAARAALDEKSPCPDQRVTIGLSGGSLIGVSVDLAVLRAELANGGAILADGAGIVLSERALDALLDTALNEEHVVRASLLVERAGTLYLEPRGAGCTNMLVDGDFVTRARFATGDSVTSLPILPGASIPVFIAGGGDKPAALPFRTPDFNIPHVPVAVTAGALPVGSGGAPGATLPTTGPTTPGSNGAPVATAAGTTGSTGAGSTPSTAGVPTPMPVLTPTPAVSTPTPVVPTPTPVVSTPPNPGHGNNGFGNGGGDGTAGKSGKSDGKR